MRLFMTEREIKRIQQTIKPKPLFEGEKTLINRLKKEKTGGPWHEQYTGRRKNLD